MDELVANITFYADGQCAIFKMALISRQDAIDLSKPVPSLYLKEFLNM